MSNCIHIQTYPPHFHYTYNLVNHFKTLTNCKELNIPIFIIFDTPEIQEQYKKKNTNLPQRKHVLMFHLFFL